NIIANLAQGARSSYLFVPENEIYIHETLELICPGITDTGRIFIQSAATDLYEDAAPMTLDWVLTNAVVAIAREGVELVYIDPWKGLERRRPRDHMLTDYIGEGLVALKQFPRHYRVAVVLVAHPTKAIQDRDGSMRIPNLSDVEQSAHWANKADNG